MGRHKAIVYAIRTPEMLAWRNMWARCYNPNYIGYQHYGGRGITIDPLWMEFEVFLRDMGPRPSARHSLHRIDNDGDYSKSNCKWATLTEQTRDVRWRFLQKINFQGGLDNP